jgi:hypothetical protein
MIRSTPHPPLTKFSTIPPAQVNLGDLSLFTVRPDIPVTDALIQAGELLRCASASTYELTDSAPRAVRPLAGSIVHLIDSARALVEASIAGLEREPAV